MGLVVGKEIVTSIRVDEDLWKEVKIHTVREGITLSEFLNHVLREKLKKSK